MPRILRPLRSKASLPESTGKSISQKKPLICNSPWLRKLVKHEHYPATYLFSLGTVYRLMGRYEEAIAAFKRALTRNPDLLPVHINLAVVYSELGREEEARAEAAEVLRLNPKYSLEVLRQRFPYKDPAVLERDLAALRKAGLK